MASTCCNIGYDLLTIVISIADVATDIIVLIDFYNKERMSFFTISLTILILAQCSYAMACAVRFNTLDNWRAHNSCLAFCCLLPFGTLVAFMIYFASEETGLECFRNFMHDGLNLKLNNSLFKVKVRDSNIVTWIKKKLDKHLGFILEAAIEAFPQSLLQIIAIVYYQEANYISVISILLSMFSVISKSLILSQGIEKYTFIWTWLCVVTDFFGIFFTLTWVFYSHNSIHGEFLGYFNILGQIWMYKFAISTLLPVVFGLVMFFGFAYWFVYCGMLCDPEFDRSLRVRVGWSSLWLTLSPILAVLCAFAACLAGEVFCFSILAMAVYAFGTDRIQNSRSDHTAELVGLMLDFISNGNDKRLRVLAINKGVYKCTGKGQQLCDFIDATYTHKDGGYGALTKITYGDIRTHCSNPKVASLLPYLFEELMQEWRGKRLASCDPNNDIIGGFFRCSELINFTSIFFWIIPVLLISKILQIIFPWIIVIYLSWNQLLFSDTIDLFQMVMLGVCIGLHLVILLLGIHVLKIHWYLWHIQPGSGSAYWGNVNVASLKKHMHEFYDNVCWYPQVETIVFDSFLGNDIGRIIMDYCKSMQLHETV
eukprot:789499_1